MAEPATRIMKDSAIATQINTLSVEPENQQELLKHMSAQATEVMAHMPGFISVNLHRSLDGTRVTNYAQWQSAKGLDEAHDNPDFVARLKGYRDLVIKAGPRIYTVVQTLGGDAKDPITIREDGGVTLINVIETEPEHQANLIELLKGGSDLVSEQPGLRTATLLRSHDDTQVVSYEQWESQEAYEVATNTSDAYAAHMKQIEEIAPPDPHLFEVAFTIRADNYDALIEKV